MGLLFLNWQQLLRLVNLPCGLGHRIYNQSQPLHTSLLNNYTIQNLYMAINFHVLIMG